MKPTLIFADDEPNIRQFCRQELEAAGYRVFVAGDGEEVLQMLDVFPVDAVIADANMPRCSGLDAAQRIRCKFPALPIVVFTSDLACSGLKSHLVNASVTKSEDLGELLSVLKELLSSSPTASS